MFKLHTKYQLVLIYFAMRYSWKSVGSLNVLDISEVKILNLNTTFLQNVLQCKFANMTANNFVRFQLRGQEYQISILFQTDSVGSRHNNNLDKFIYRYAK
jgi:hypothetical protein